MSSKKILIAKVVSVFGIKGEVKIMSYCHNPNDLEKYPLFNKNDEKVTVKFRKSQKDANPLIGQINSIKDRNTA
jgi:ribosomal 30S subunit maturation factor RimM